MPPLVLPRKVSRRVPFGVERNSPLALVSYRGSKELVDTSEAPLEWTSPKGTTYRGYMSAIQELMLSDLQLRPSSSGQGTFQVYLTFQGNGNSSQDLSQSRNALALQVRVEPKELPLLSGLIGRSFSARWRLPEGVAEMEALRQELALTREKYLNLRSLLSELSTLE